MVARTPVMDMLGLLTLDWDKLRDWQKDPSKFAQEDFDRLRKSGIDVFHPAVEPNRPDAFEGAREWVDGWNHMFSSHPDYFLRIDNAQDIGRSKIEGKIGVVIGFQNSDHFRTVRDVQLFYDLGQRVSQLTYNSRNLLGCGCVESRDGGLTPYGAEIIAQMNRTGMAVDASHAGERTALDAIETSKAPILISHSNCKSLVPHHPRCVSDDVIRALAAKGGVIGITDIPSFVWHDRPVTIDHLLDHYEHVARLVGVDHVGIGSDSDLDSVNSKRKVPFWRGITGLNLAQRVFDVTEGLFRRGYGERHLELILGGNFARLLDTAWKGQPIPSAV
jgi:membrane dipeptidase